MGFLKRAGCAVAGITLCAGSTFVMADVVVIVSTANPVKTLASNQVANIFLGKASRFPEGGQAIPIDQPEGAAVRDEFYTRYTGKSAAQLKTHWSKIIFTGRGQPPDTVSNSAEVKTHVAGNPAAIGYIDAREVDDSVRVVPADPQ
ncbi:phosphate ABC transporter substrate-binding protein [Pseudomonas sp. B21-028]|uniref:phosphate ABC transporter substrate-binding protein n=1 Tax=Pseudomonas sp. B21-028 TaxID=2895480 RepID=UPI00215EFDAC|nr:phosphate ABC transporter substrate-binding protein [Pseudomonas sp. B21-028]UVL86436.1 phosphate ABC transporter substrate-binding protein [Pseudomonas sp. B21-028]